MAETERQERQDIPTGTVGGFHYGNKWTGCNGLYRATKETLPDGRQVYECDVCGTRGAMKVEAKQQY